MDLRAEQRKIVLSAASALAFCAGAFVAGQIVLPRYFQFPVDRWDRLAFALRADVFVFLWVVIAVRMVSKGRFHSAADNKGSAFAPPRPAIAVQAAFLQNTLEQAVIAFGAHLALATLLSSPWLAIIPTAVALFAVGRWTFLAGYRKGAAGRAFGMAVTAIPTAAAYVLAILLMFNIVSVSE